MAEASKWRNHFQEHQILFTILAVGLFLLELEIFALAAVHSRPETRLQVYNHQNQVVYETRAGRMDAREKVEFENTFGPLSEYQVRRTTLQRSFPFRAWLAAAVGLPIGAVLLFGFFVKAYEALFLKTDDAGPLADLPGFSGGKMDRIVARIGRLNIFAVGGFVLLFAVGLFAVPQMVAEFGRFGAGAVARYKWGALAVLVVGSALVIWVIFLRYRLACKAIEARAEVEKYRLRLEFGENPKAAAFLPDSHQTIQLPRSLPPELSEKD